jgi:hypothetical protein
MNSRNGFILVGVVLALALSVMSCSQYEYTSPTPGILEVHLKTKNSRTTFMPFGTSQFSINMKDLEAIRPNGARLEILPDLLAIRRSEGGEIYNTLDTLARDSTIVMGRAYAPPGDYSRVHITASIQEDFVFKAGVAGIPVAIPVIQPLPPPPALKELPRAGQTLNISVNEGRITRVNLMLDLDSTLIRRAESFEGSLQFYVSSVQNF